MVMWIALVLALAVPANAQVFDQSPDAYADPDITVQYSDTVAGCEWWTTNNVTNELLDPAVALPAGNEFDQFVASAPQHLDSGTEVAFRARCWVVDERDGTSLIYSEEAIPLVRPFLAPRLPPAPPVLEP